MYDYLANKDYYYYCKQHIQNSKMKVTTRNNILKNLANGKWGTNAICCSSMDEIFIRRHTGPRSKQSMPSYHRMSQATIYGGLVYFTGNRAFRHQEKCIRQNVKKQTNGTRYALPVSHSPAKSRLKSRNEILTSVKPSYFCPNVVRCNECQRGSRDK